MKTSLHTGEVSPPPAQAAGWGLKIGAEHGGGSEKQSFGVENSLDEPSDGRIIAKETSKTQFYAMNNMVKWENLALDEPDFLAAMAQPVPMKIQERPARARKGPNGR